MNPDTGPLNFTHTQPIDRENGERSPNTEFSIPRRKPQPPNPDTHFSDESDHENRPKYSFVISLVLQQVQEKR